MHSSLSPPEHVRPRPASSSENLSARDETVACTPLEKVRNPRFFAAQLPLSVDCWQRRRRLLCPVDEANGTHSVDERARQQSAKEGEAARERRRARDGAHTPSGATLSGLPFLAVECRLARWTNSARNIHSRHAGGCAAAVVLEAALARMNPTQYKKAMRQRALERRAELERAEALPQPSLGATHPPRRDSFFSSAARVGQERGVVPKLQVHGDDSEGGSAATSFASAAAGGGSVEGLGDHDHDQVRRDISREIEDVNSSSSSSGEFRRHILVKGSPPK